MRKGLLSLVWLLLVSTAVSWSQDAPTPPAETAAKTPEKTPPPNSAESVYLQLRTVGLDKARVYRLRDVSIDRAAIQITLNDGTIAFTEDVAGRVTGAFFEGDGEVLLAPPNTYERASMALFTNEAILEERFVTAYFRFNDDTFSELRPSLVPVDYAEAFLSQWNETARNLAEGDALRLFTTFSKFLPVAGQTPEDAAMLVKPATDDDLFLHARLQGLRVGVFDLYFDAATA